MAEQQKNLTTLKEELDSLNKIADETLAIANKKPAQDIFNNSSDGKKLKKKNKKLKKHNNAELEESKKKSQEELNNLSQRVNTLEQADFEREKDELKNAVFGLLQSLGSTK